MSRNHPPYAAAPRHSAARLMTCLLLSCLAPAESAAQTAAVPPAYQDLFASLSSYLQSFHSEINAGWNGNTYPVGFAGQLTTASSNVGPKLISADYFTNAVVPELNELKALGVKAVLVPVNFPILYAGFYAKPSDYQAYVNFYIQLGNAIRARGLKMIVETGATLSQSGFNSWNVGPFYASLTWSQYESGRSQQAGTIAGQIKPDYLTVISEPDTEAAQTGFAAAGTVSGSTEMLNMILSAVRQAGAASLPVGAGVGSWMPSYQSWFQSFAGAGVQYLDIHVFPVNRTFLTQLPAMADYAASLGKPVASSQCWLNKVRDSELGSATYLQTAARDPFSFWAPLDIAFLQGLVNFAYWKHAVFVAPFWTFYFHAYLDYNSTAGLTPNQILAAASSQAAQAISRAQYTATGISWGKAVLNPPDTVAPTVPTGLSGRANANSASISWNPSKDQTGVAGYVMFRNGVRLATLPGTVYYDVGLAPATSYSYTVAAYDGVMNVSAAAPPIVVTTLR